METGEAIGLSLLVLGNDRGRDARTACLHLVHEALREAGEGLQSPPSETRAFEDACNGAGIPCEIHAENRDRTMQVWVTEKRAADARRLLSR